MEFPLAQLPPKERQLLLLIRERGLILTRIKERGSDVGSVQPTAAPRQEGGTPSQRLRLDDDEVLTCLYALEARGLVRSHTTALRTSTTEYAREWTLRRGP